MRVVRSRDGEREMSDIALVWQQRHQEVAYTAKLLVSLHGEHRFRCGVSTTIRFSLDLTPSQKHGTRLSYCVRLSFENCRNSRRHASLSANGEAAQVSKISIIDSDLGIVYHLIQPQLHSQAYAPHPVRPAPHS
jgi:hypothetical protein